MLVKYGPLPVIVAFCTSCMTSAAAQEKADLIKSFDAAAQVVKGDWTLEKGELRVAASLHALV